MDVCNEQLRWLRWRWADSKWRAGVFSKARVARRTGANNRKLPRRVDSSKLDFSGRILHSGRFNEEIEVQRVADRCHPEGG
jgi:hypothetical protein